MDKEVKVDEIIDIISTIILEYVEEKVECST
jgi:hypothetical protein